MKTEAFLSSTSLLFLTVWIYDVCCGPPRWRAYTSSSYYYTDYTFPKPQQPPPKHKFVPEPQFCPNTGRTVCEAAPHYPDEHIFHVVSSGKGRRFNFSSIFVDERDGDTDPNSDLLPESPPSPEILPPHRDGYIVYQTAVHYDYHVPPPAAAAAASAAPAVLPWLYGSAAAGAGTPGATGLSHATQSAVLRGRRRPLLRRHQRAENDDERSACPVRTMFVPPRAALSDSSEWRYIVNVENKDPRFKQIIRVDVCESPDEPCTREISLPFGFVSRCKQKFIKKKLLALDSDGQGMSADNFFIPSCCVCHVSRSIRRRK